MFPKITVLFFLLILTTSIFSQASGVFPDQTGGKWFFRNVPLDSLEQPMDSLAFIRVDTFASVEEYYGKNSNIYLSKLGTPSTLPVTPFLDTVGYAVEENVVWQLVDIANLADTSLIPDTSLANLLYSLQGWYPVYDFDAQTNDEYVLLRIDTTLILNDTEIPFRVEVTTERNTDETIPTILGNLECYKFRTTLKLAYLIELPFVGTVPVYFLQYPINQWINDGNWIVEEYSPSINVDLSFFGLPAFYIPGRTSKLINQPAYIVLQSPAGGEVYYNGEQTQIKWNSWHAESVDLFFSSDSGDNWTELATGISATSGEYDWNVPADIASDKCMVRVDVADDEYAYDENKTPFTIRAEPQFEFTYPTASDTITPGGTYNITWNAQNLESIMIQYSMDYGNNYSLVVDSIDASEGSFEWDANDIGVGEMILRARELRAPFKVFYSDTIRVDVIEDIDANDNLPVEYALYNNYPNPFNPSTRISFAVPESGIVNLVIYDILGQKVSTVTNRYYNAGNYTLNFDASGLNSGVYFYRMTSNNKSFVKKMILTK